MAKAQYIGIDGVARKVVKDYIGVEGVARNVTKSYVGVDGVARQCFESTSGVKWEKYNCNVSTTKTHTQVTSGTPLNTTGTHSHAGTYTMYPNYSWGGSSTGYHVYGTGKTLSAAGTGAVGYYHMFWINNKYWAVHQVTSVTYNSSSGNYTCGYKVVAAETQTSKTNYSKGSTSYGTVTAPEGELPEAGTLTKGSATSSYCILKIGSTYYYYVKVS